MTSRLRLPDRYPAFFAQAGWIDGSRPYSAVRHAALGRLGGPWRGCGRWGILSQVIFALARLTLVFLLTLGLGTPVAVAATPAVPAAGVSPGAMLSLIEEVAPGSGRGADLTFRVTASAVGEEGFLMMAGVPRAPQRRNGDYFVGYADVSHQTVPAPYGSSVPSCPALPSSSRSPTPTPSPSTRTPSRTSRGNSTGG